MSRQDIKGDNEPKKIRFIDPHYNLKFYLPDGGKIRITNRNGESFERPCKYIDDYHLYVGSCCYHICEFAERMEVNGSKVEPIEANEPQKNKQTKHKDLER